MRGVGDELALRLHHLLGLRACRVELAKHLVERPRELGDLVVGVRASGGAARVPGARDLARGGGQRRDRAHRAARDRVAGERGEQGSAEHPEPEEEPDPADRRLERRALAGVLDEDLAADRAGRDLLAGDGQVARPGAAPRAAGRGRGGSALGLIGRPLIVDDLDVGVAREDEVVEAEVAVRHRALAGRRIDVELEPVGDVVGRALRLLVEVGLELVDREAADDERERQQDEKRQHRRDGGDSRLDRPAGGEEGGQRAGRRT